MEFWIQGMAGWQVNQFDRLFQNEKNSYRNEKNSYWKK
jgi:hypothetical protein